MTNPAAESRELEARNQPVFDEVAGIINTARWSAAGSVNAIMTVPSG